MNSIAFYWSLWPHGLKCRPWSLRHWDSQFESHLRHGCLSLSIHHHHSLVTLSSTLCSLVTEKASQNKPPSLNKSVSSPAPHVIIQSHVIFPEIQELMLSTTRAAKRDHVARTHTYKIQQDWLLKWLIQTSTSHGLGPDISSNQQQFQPNNFNPSHSRLQFSLPQLKTSTL
jgi:hypothetical protein